MVTWLSLTPAAPPPLLEALKSKRGLMMWGLHQFTFQCNTNVQINVLFGQQIRRQQHLDVSEEKTLIILPLSDTTVAPSSMVSASAPSIYSVQALSLLAEVRPSHLGGFGGY